MNKGFFKFTIIITIAIALLLCVGAINVLADESENAVSRDKAAHNEAFAYIGNIESDPAVPNAIKQFLLQYKSNLYGIEENEYGLEGTYDRIMTYRNQAESAYNVSMIYFSFSEDMQADAKALYNEIKSIINNTERFDYALLFAPYVAPVNDEIINPECGYCAALNITYADKQLDALLASDIAIGDKEAEVGGNLYNIVDNAKNELRALEGEENTGYKSTAYSEKISETEKALALRRQKNNAIVSITDLCTELKKDHKGTEFDVILNAVIQQIELSTTSDQVAAAEKDAKYQLIKIRFELDYSEALNYDVENLSEDQITEALKKLREAVTALERTGETYEDLSEILLGKIEKIISDLKKKTKEAVAVLMQDAVDFTVSENISLVVVPLSKAIDDCDDFSVDKKNNILETVGKHAVFCRNWLSDAKRRELADITLSGCQKILDGENDPDGVVAETKRALEIAEATASLEDYVDRHIGLYPDIDPNVEKIKADYNQFILEKHGEGEYKAAADNAKKRISALYAIQEKKKEAYNIINDLSDYSESEKKALILEIDADIALCIQDLTYGEDVDVDSLKKDLFDGVDKIGTDAKADNLTRVKNDALSSLEIERQNLLKELDIADYINGAKKNELKAQFEASYTEAKEKINSSSKISDVKQISQNAIADMKIKQSEIAKLDDDACVSIFLPIIVGLAVFGVFEAVALVLIIRRKKREGEEAASSAVANGVAMVVSAFAFEITAWSLTTVLGVTDVMLAIFIVYFALKKPRKAVVMAQADEETDKKEQDDPLDLDAFLVESEKKSPCVAPQVEDEQEEETDELVEEEPHEEQIKAVYLPKAKVRQAIVNIDQLEKYFEEGDTVDVDVLKEKALIPKKAGCIKVLGRGALHKPLVVVASEFSLTAQKMILEAGGVAKLDATEVIING